MRSKQRRSAAVVLWALGCLTALHLAWSLIGENPALRDPEYGARLKHLQHRVHEAPERPLILALGSSRLLFGLAADGPSRSTSTGPMLFNMGITGAGPANELIMLRRVLQEGIRPRAVIIEVLPRSLCKGSADSPLQEDVPQQRRSWKDRDVLPPGESWLCLLDWLVPPWSDLRFGLMHQLAPTWVPPDRREQRYRTTPFGWLEWREQPLPAHRARLVETNRQEFTRVMWFRDINRKADKILHLLFDECHRQRIDVLALVTMPESSEFRSWYGPGTREVMVKYLSGLCREQGSRYIDATEWIPDSGFGDGHHLVTPGATAFTERLWREVMQPEDEKVKVVASAATGQCVVKR